jgi:hypothetical protein
MTPDELDRELADLDRFSPPPVDPARLLALETRASDLAQENTDLRHTIGLRDARIAELQTASDQRTRELLALKTAQQRREKDWESERADWLGKQQYWSSLALRERSDLRAIRTRWIQSAGLAIAGMAVCLGFWIAGEKYWTFTHDDQLRMMQSAARDKAEALAAYRNASKDLADAARLRNQIRKTKKTPNAATREGGEKTGPQSP